MISVVQRWRVRRDSYRPAGEPIRTSDFEVAELFDDVTAKLFVVAHHYSASYPAARFRFGLYEHGALVGVAVFSHPANEHVLDAFPGERLASTELGRFVLLDRVPANGETWFLARAFELLRRRGLVGALAFSDPMPRATAAGRVVMPGHIGTIYQAHNGLYLGQSQRRTLRLLADGTVLSARAVSKVRARERGWRYAAALLERAGAAPLGDADPRAWLATWLPRLTRAVRHPGNHRYAWAIDPRARRAMAARLHNRGIEPQPYPKQSRAA